MPDLCKPNLIICSCAFYVLVLSHQWALVPVTSTCILSILCILICVLFISNIEHLCQIDCFAAFILSMDIETSLCSLWSVVAWSFCAWWVYERAVIGAGLESRWTRDWTQGWRCGNRQAPSGSTRWLGSSPTKGAPLLDCSKAGKARAEEYGDWDEAGGR